MLRSIVEKQFAKYIHSHVINKPSINPAMIPSRRFTSLIPGTNPISLITLLIKNSANVPTISAINIDIPCIAVSLSSLEIKVMVASMDVWIESFTLSLIAAGTRSNVVILENALRNIAYGQVSAVCSRMKVR